MIQHLSPLILALPLFVAACAAVPKALPPQSLGGYAGFSSSGESVVQPVQQTRPAEAPSFATLGHWQNLAAPNGQQTQVWVPADSSLSSEEPPLDPDLDPSLVTLRIHESYASNLGRYDTLRYSDGQVEFQWKAEEPSTPQQGYWQILPNQQRVWMTGAQSAVGER